MEIIALRHARPWAGHPRLCRTPGKLLLGGRRVIPEKALASGFAFRHETLRSALSAMLGASAAAAQTRSRAQVLSHAPAGK